MAVIRLARDILAAAFHPNSRVNIVIVDKHGMYNNPTRASIMNWTGVKTAARFGPTKATNIRSVNSFLTAPNISNMPVTAGRPNHNTVIGVKAALIGPSAPETYKACTNALPIMYIGKTK